MLSEKAGRLLISEELEEVLPLEDAEKLEQAKPITPSGEVKLDPAKARPATTLRCGRPSRAGRSA